ncbi:hypothetical protein EIL50_03595 [bacterium NHP-B]|nr:hypothetical protein EIL50_03595 [bacterium NHP-B]
MREIDMTESTNMAFGHGINAFMYDRLQDHVNQAATQNVTGQQCEHFHDMGGRTWPLLGAVVAKNAADRMANFCDEQKPFISRFQAGLLSLQDTLIVSAQNLTEAATTWNTEEDFPAFQQAMRSCVNNTVTLLNTYFEGSGYLFGGAQTDLRPINPLLIEDLCREEGAELSLGSVDAYVVDGPFCERQQPLTLFYDGESTQPLTLPLQAKDVRFVFSVFESILSLTPENAAEGIHNLQGAFDGTLHLVKQAILDTSTLQNTFDRINEEAHVDQDVRATQVDNLVNVDPLASAQYFYDTSSELSAFLQFTLISKQFEQSLLAMMSPQR